MSAGQWVFVPAGSAVLIVPVPPAVVDDNPCVVRGDE